jgi:hypothetical protein
LLDRIFDEYGLIVSGWSGEWDSALRAAFLRAPNRRYATYWTCRGSLSEAAREITDHRKARVLTVKDADNFFAELLQSIETLDQTRRQNPIGVELLVNTAKRYIAKPEHRNQLDDLVTQAAERMLAALDIPDLAPEGVVDQKSFVRRLHTYEAATEPLARSVGAFGRWGDGSETALVVNLIQVLNAHAERVGSGIISLLALRSYPAVLIFTAYGLGLTVARRWRALHELFSFEVLVDARQHKRVVEELFLSGWRGGEKTLWNHAFSLPNGNTRKTPLSDYLCTLFIEWGKSFTGVTQDHEGLCETFEVLGSIAYLESASEQELERRTAGSEAPLWTPMGRVSWHGSSLSRITQEINREPVKASLLKAGFAKGSPKFLDLSIQNLGRVAQRAIWQ